MFSLKFFLPFALVFLQLTITFSRQIQSVSTPEARDVKPTGEIVGCDFEFVHTTEELVEPIASGNDLDWGDYHTLYTCRVHHVGNLVLGEYKMETGYCNIAWNGFEFTYIRNIELLTNPRGANYTWMTQDDLPVLPGVTVIEGGLTAAENETIYVGMCYHTTLIWGASWLPGYYRVSTGAHYSFSGNACPSGYFTFLTCTI